MENSVNHLIKKLLVGALALLVIVPAVALAARTSVDWVNLSGTSYIQPNFGVGGVDLLISGSNHYINFNAVTGSSGYGFRDNAGTIEFKNSGGSWTGIGSGGGGGTGAATSSFVGTYPVQVTPSASAITISSAFGTTSNSGMSQGSLYVGSGGIFQTAASSSIFGYTPLNPTRALTINGTANQITSSAGAQDLSADRTWTLSLPNHVKFPVDFEASAGTTTNATTTGSQYFTGITASRLLYVDSTGKLGSGGTGTSGNCVQWGANNTLADAGAVCGTGGGGVTAVAATYPLQTTGSTGSITLSTAFGTTTGWGIGNDVFIYTSHTGVPLGVASSSLNLPNTALQNSSLTVNGTSISLGGSQTITANTTNSLTFNNGGSGAASGSTFNGSGAVTVSYNTLGAVPATRNVNTTFPLQGGGALSGDLTLTTAFGTTTNTGLPVDSFIYTSHTGILLGVASSSLALPNSALANSTISGHALGTNIDNLSHDSTLTGTTYNGNGAVSNWGIDLTHANTWTGLQQFSLGLTAYSTSTIGSGTQAGGLTISGGATTTGFFVEQGSGTSTFVGGINADTQGNGCGFADNGVCLQTFIQNAAAYKSAANYATAAVLPGTPTYSNGVSGVGATLTEVGFGALVVDGQTVSLSQRILVKNQADQTQNGVYTVTTVGSGIANYVLTRSTDYNTPNDIYAGTTIPVLAGGTANGNTQWTESTTGNITIGSSNIAFIETSYGTNGTVTSVAVTVPAFLSIGGSPVTTAGTLAISYSGTALPIANGGTGATSLTGDQFLYTNHAGTAVLTVASSSLNLPNSALQNSTISGIALGNNLNSFSVGSDFTGTSYNGSASVSDWAIKMSQAHNWTALQTFLNASSSLLSVTNTAYFGGTGTSTFASTGALTLVNAANALTIPALGTAAGTFLAADASGHVIATTSPLGGGSGTVTSVTCGTGLSGGTFSTSGTCSLNLGNANIWTVLQSFSLASTTQLSVFNKAFFGGTATTTIDSAGNIAVPNGSNISINAHNIYPRWRDGLNLSIPTTTDETSKLGNCLEPGGPSVTIDKVAVIISTSTAATATDGMTFNINIADSFSTTTAPQTLFTTTANQDVYSTSTQQTYTSGFSQATIPAGYCWWWAPGVASTTQIQGINVNLFGYQN